jgi:hypothetical protein
VTGETKQGTTTALLLEQKVFQEGVLQKIHDRLNGYALRIYIRLYRAYI